VLSLIRSQEPAPIFFTGDMPIRGVRWAPPIEYLKSLQEINQVYLVPGNHDWPRTRRRDIEGTGAIMLLNRSVPLERNGTRIWIAGVDDPDESEPDLNLALTGIGPDESVILLAHSPDIYEEANGRVDLILCGHTHGGQIRLPWIGALITHTHKTPRHLCMGRHRLSERTQLFVSRGVGTSRWMPARFLCPPEISLIALHGALKPGRPQSQSAIAQGRL
jgi:hypothetical protein